MIRRALNLILLIAIFVGYTAQGQATNIDVRTHDEVIERIESSLKGIDDKSVKTGAHLRLADLYADKARLVAMQEVEKGCKNCTESVLARKAAINHYQSAFKHSEKPQQARIIMQIAHLYVLNNETATAQKIFENIIADRGNRSDKLLGEAYAGLGEIQFSKGQYDKAKANFIKALSKPISKPLYATHRLAWCYFNEGNTRKARSLVKTTLNSKVEKSDGFKKDLVRDLATFTARSGINSESIAEIMKHSSLEDQKSNLFYLGKEADRLGNRQGALLVWSEYAKLGSIDKNESLEIKLRTAQNLFDQGSSTGALSKYNEFYTAFGNPRCKVGDICQELKDRSRNFIKNWIKKEKTGPTKNLQIALTTYTNNNPSDIEMLQWGGHISKYTTNYLAAAQFYAKAADQSHRLKDDKNTISSLLAEVEAAEDSESTQQKEASYRHFLALSPKNKKYDEIRYQLAYLDYEKKNYTKAQAEFHRLATQSTLDSDLKIKAADLSLDSLAILKNKSALEKVALSYAKLFTSKKKEYLAIARKAGINIAIENSTGSPSESLNKLSQINLSGASPDEKLNFYRNKILIAESAQDLGAIDAAAIGMLSVKGLSAKEQEYALGQRLSVAESKFQFQKAYRIAKKMKFPHMKTEDRLLKMALLAELAGRTSRSYYQAYIDQTPSRRKANVIRAKFVVESRNPWKEVDKYKSKLLSTPGLYADLLVDIYAKHRNADKLAQHLKYRNVRASSSGQILQSFLDLKTFDEERQASQRLRLDSRSDSRLARSIQKRVKQLKRLEKLAEQSVRKSRFPVQVRYYKLLENEYRRMHTDVLKLSTPKRLSKAQKTEYRKLLKQQADPFLEAANNAKASTKTLWKNSKSFRDMLASSDLVRGGHATLLKFELEALSLEAPSWHKGQILGALRKIDVPSKSESRKAFQAAKNDPFNVDKLKELKDLESRRGQRTMVAYLEARILASKGGKK